MKFLTPIIILGMAIALFFFYVDPTYQNIQAAQSQNTQYTQEIQSAKDAIAKRDQLLTKYNSLSSDQLATLTAALPDTVDPVNLVISINSLAQRYGTNIHDIKLPDSTASNETQAMLNSNPIAYGTSPITFTVSLTYQNFLSFLNDLEHSLRLADVSSVGFMPNDSGIYDFNFVLNTYWLK